MDRNWMVNVDLMVPSPSVGLLEMEVDQQVIEELHRGFNEVGTDWFQQV